MQTTWSRSLSIHICPRLFLLSLLVLSTRQVDIVFSAKETKTAYFKHHTKQTCGKTCVTFDLKPVQPRGNFAENLKPSVFCK